MSLRNEPLKRYWIARRSVARRVQRRGDKVFWTRYGEMADSVLAFLESNQMTLTERHVAVVGCGDGATTMGLAHSARPSLIVGFDHVAPTAEGVLTLAREAGVASRMPAGVHFESFASGGIPAAAATFDAVVMALAWSDLGDLAGPLTAAGRVLRPGGVLALVLSRDWPRRFTTLDEDPLDSLRPSLEEAQGIVLSAGLEVAAVRLDAPQTAVRGEQSWVPLASLAVRRLALLARMPERQGR